MTSQELLRNPFEGGKVLSDVQLKGCEKAYRELKTEVISEDKDFSSKQTLKLKEALESLKEISSKAATSRTECVQKISELKQQSQGYQEKISKYETASNSANHDKEYKEKIQSLEKQHVGNCKRRIEIAKGLDIRALKKLDIDERKSEANEVFKWIIVSLYGEPESKFYWPNFKEQALEEDKGADLVERLGKYDALHAKEQQRVKTTRFLEQFDSIKKAEELKGYQNQVNGIHEIAQLFLSSSDIGRSIKDVERRIEMSRADSMKGDQENLQNVRNNKAILERIRVSQAYINQLDQMQKLLDGKHEKYSSQIQLGDSYVAELNKLSSYDYKVPEQEKRDNCECTVY